MTLTEIEERVQSELDRRHSEIVVSVFKHMVNKHNDITCGCNYCQRLRGYVDAIRREHHIRKAIERYYDEGGYRFVDLDIAKYNVRWLKKEKDSLKWF